MITYRVDCGAESYVPLCRVCSWRGLPRLTRAAAAAAADVHAAQIHRVAARPLVAA